MLDEAFEGHLDGAELGELKQSEWLPPARCATHRLAQPRVHGRGELRVRGERTRHRVEQQDVVRELVHLDVLDGFELIRGC